LIYCKQLNCIVYFVITVTKSTVKSVAPRIGSHEIRHPSMCLIFTCFIFT